MRAWLMILLLAAANGAAASDNSKLVSLGASVAAPVRYRVTLSAEAEANLEAFLPQLLAACRCRQEPYAELGFTGIVIAATPSGARLLSMDPRVKLVEELEGETEPAPAVPALVADPVVTAAPSSVVTAAGPWQPAAEAVANWETGHYAYDAAGNIKAIASTRSRTTHSAASARPG